MTSHLDYGDFADLIHICRNQLVVRHFIALGKKLGWQETTTQGKGSHIALVREGYAPVEIPCHGRGKTLGKGIAHQILSRLLEPLAVAEAEVLSKSQHESWEAWLLKEQVRFNTEAEMALQILLAQVEAQIDVYETEILSEAEQLAAQLAHDQAQEKSTALNVQILRLQVVIEAQTQQLQDMKAEQAILAQAFQQICDRYNQQQLRLQAAQQTLEEVQPRFSRIQSRLGATQQQTHDLEVRWFAQQEAWQQQETKLIAEQQQVRNLALQLKLTQKRQKRVSLRLGLVAIAATVVVCSPAPTWVKGLFVLVIPPLTHEMGYRQK